jgi:DNA invertase Pin-like site-specific DNA recombinase
MNPDQITAAHRSRLAYVYVRQSSPHQVVVHQESQRRQRGLVDRALSLGWAPEQIVVVDEDLGSSAGRSHKRSGFPKIVAGTALGQAGLILGLEVSRITRGNRDWYHLLDICAITGTLIADHEGLYDPRAYNDRLLLGLKGTMSEAELHMMKQRLVEAVLTKAGRGEFRFRLKAGYVWDEAGRVQKTPDEQVRCAIELIFRRFAELGAVHQVQCSLAEEGLRVPVACGRGGQIEWRPPREEYLRGVLSHPIYAGAYVYGRRQVEEILDASHRPRKRVRQRPREKWHVLIRDHHEGYISWEVFERNQRQITSNRRGEPSPGAPREGRALLAGLLLCGRCGRRMKVGYQRQRRSWHYVCVAGRQQTGAPPCQRFGALRLERAVEGLLLEALEPVGLEAMIQGAAAHVEAGQAQQAHWKHKVERARYEVDLARRQYDAVDPANRLVARELERRWEKVLSELQTVEAEAARQIEALDRPLTAQEQQRLRRYASDLGSLWNAPSTRPQDRKRLARCLIENVVVTVPPDDGMLKAQVHWVGGELTTVEVPRGRSGVTRHASDAEVVELVRMLAPEFADDQIARILSRKRLKTGTGLAFNAQRVTNLRSYHNIAGRTRAKCDPKDTYTAEQAAEILGVSRSTVIIWIETGLLVGTQVTAGAPWRVRLTQEDRRRLTAADAPEGWLPLKGAATALGVSQQTVLQRLKSGQVEAVRVRVGRRSGWRIAVPARTCAEQTSLFGPSDL